jgi:hypothetical protein
MASITFLINDESIGGPAPTVQVTITENPDGTLTFEVTQLASGGYFGDLRGIFFDVRDENLIGSLLILNSSGGPLTEVRTGNDNVTDLGGGANMNGLLGTVDPANSVPGAEGNGYDMGLETGTAGIGSDDVRTFTFTLDSSARALTLADFEGVDFAVRIASVGQVDANGEFVGPRDSGTRILENINNTAPTSTDDAVTTDEDTAIVLSLDDFGFYVDAENTDLAAVKITALPANGSLQYDASGAGTWAAVALNQVIAASEIGAGRLRFVPDANENGAGYATIGFQVSDGIAFSNDSYTLTVDVAPVNDAPKFESPQIVRVNTDASGQEANEVTHDITALSSDGRFVAFSSLASNLVPGDTNDAWDVFVKDTQTGAIARASTTSSGAEASGSEYYPTGISADGRYVAFATDASDLIPNDTNGDWDVFVKDMQTGSIVLASADAAGVQAAGHSNIPTLSADGRYVA